MPAQTAALHRASLARIFLRMRPVRQLCQGPPCSWHLGAWVSLRSLGLHRCHRAGMTRCPLDASDAMACPAISINQLSTHSLHGPRSPPLPSSLPMAGGHRHHAGMTSLPPQFSDFLACTAISIKRPEQARLGAWRLAQSPSASSPLPSTRSQYAAMARGTLARRPTSSVSLLASARAWPVGWAGCGRSAWSM